MRAPAQTFPRENPTDMFSPHIGVPISIDGAEGLRVVRGETGHAVYGPYQHMRPGVFRVDYPLALAAADPGDADAICATIDVSAASGVAVLARQDVTIGELATEPRTFSLTFTLREFRSLEYRVFTQGVTGLVLGGPRVTRLGDVIEAEAPADPRIDTPDPVEQHRQVRAVLRLLRPQRVKGFAKVRLGHAGDGGYVCIDDFAGLDAALSFGINDDISWDIDAADRGMTIHQFDHTVEDPAPADPRMVFQRKMIAPESGPDSASLGDLVRVHDRGEARPNMMLKMDIEGGEWPVLDVTDVKDVSRFTQIVCELHYFQGLAEPEYRRSIYDGLSKLHEGYAVVHVHANISGGISNVGNVIFPNVIEVTFANRAVYELEETDELFPGPLDISCDADQPDMYLGSFRF